MTPTSAVGPAIRRARERLQMTQKELANKVGVNVKTVDNWENGRTHPKNRLGALEDALSISLREPSGRNDLATDVIPEPDTEARIAAIEAIDELDRDEKDILIAYIRANRARTEAQEERRRGA